jgi:hypothetical protein
LQRFLKHLSLNADVITLVSYQLNSQPYLSWRSTRSPRVEKLDHFGHASLEFHCYHFINDDTVIHGPPCQSLVFNDGNVVRHSDLPNLDGVPGLRQFFCLVAVLEFVLPMRRTREASDDKVASRRAPSARFERGNDALGRDFFEQDQRAFCGSLTISSKLNSMLLSLAACFWSCLRNESPARQLALAAACYHAGSDQNGEHRR